jgi:hypothetical protein
MDCITVIGEVVKNNRGLVEQVKKDAVNESPSTLMEQIKSITPRKVLAILRRK